MPDQLSLRLDPALPNPPAGLRPMLARPIPEPFDSTSFLFEPSWGGQRVLVVIGPADEPGAGSVAILDEQGRALPVIPVELVGLSVRVAARSAVLDGELVVVDDRGRGDRGELDRRLGGGPGRPVTLLAFDLLHLDGRSLLQRPLDRRREELRRVLRPGDEVLTVPAIPGEGRALHAAVAAQGLAGVLARQRSSPYLPGVRSRLWRFVPAGPATPPALDGAAGAMAADAASPEAATDDDAIAVSGSGSAPVLALIRRLPLGLDDPAPDPPEPGGD